MVDAKSLAPLLDGGADRGTSLRKVLGQHHRHEVDVSINHRKNGSACAEAHNFRTLE